MTKHITTADVVSRIKQTHGDRYNCDFVVYTGSKDEVSLVCNEHGEFWIRLDHAINGSGCQKCGSEARGNAARKTTQQFIRDAREVHGFRYSYDRVEYNHSFTPVTISCPSHGDFEQMPDVHIQGSGCQTCGKESKGENSVAAILTGFRVDFEREKRFDSCRNINPLPFDFYVPSHNLLIEYDGVQHFEALGGWNDEANLEETQYHDAIKNEWAAENGYDLLRIPYTEFDNLLDILDRWV